MLGCIYNRVARHNTRKASVKKSTMTAAVFAIPVAVYCKVRCIFKQKPLLTLAFTASALVIWPSYVRGPEGEMLVVRNFDVFVRADVWRFERFAGIRAAPCPSQKARRRVG